MGTLRHIFSTIQGALSITRLEYGSRLGGGNVIVNGALRDGTTTGDLMLAHPEGMQPQYFLQLAHGQPFLWQRGFSTYQWSLPPRLRLRRRSNPMPITVPNYRRNTDRFQFGLLIDITSEY